MKQLRHAVIRAGLDAMSLTGVHRLLAPIFSGVGTIFTMHHVRPAHAAAFQPNHHLEITPDFLRATLEHVRAADVDIVTMDEVRRRLKEGDLARRFVAFTFDDGYRDNRDHALPVMREFGAPMTIFVASDFADGRGLPWWIAIERLLAKADAIEIDVDGTPQRIPAHTVALKEAAFAHLHEWVRNMPDERIARSILKLCARHDVDAAAISGELCMNWDELREIAADPLVTLGAHTASHCNLAQQTEVGATCEMRASRGRIEDAIGKPVAHLCYPYGDRHAAGPREFALAEAAGFATAVTTRPAMLFAEHAAQLTALPRVSLNGNYQNARYLPVLTSGAATAMWNGFRKNAAA
jgi:peptidoglycan/xylan/chitin deacetylase (PgdA/CDA1 family)